jgi:hypothetical protein
MALLCSFCGRPVGAVEPPGSPVSCCRECALEYLPVVLAEALLTGGKALPRPAEAGADFAQFLRSFADATERALGRLIGYGREKSNGHGHPRLGKAN